MRRGEGTSKDQPGELLPNQECCPPHSFSHTAEPWGTPPPPPRSACGTSPSALTPCLGFLSLSLSFTVVPHTTTMCVCKRGPHLEAGVPPQEAAAQDRKPRLNTINHPYSSPSANPHPSPAPHPLQWGPYRAGFPAGVSPNLEANAEEPSHKAINSSYH